ncbi:TspO/MBR family protein [Smaragdicoccus niigatensis]|uniref:TspO/MBR family protein n=1 Tax=Smaragdicoccus niigatensis TaxID=359359 RepID=UPI000369A2B6|nr:TspO/MBR family protein [Smaragdicoccus niigatensis]
MAESRNADRAALVVSLVAVGAVAVIGGLSSANAGAEYQLLEQPSWAPPSWLFGPVWTVLYISMAVAAWLVWRSNSPHRLPGLAAYGIQLVLNLAWTPLFFALALRLAALVDIVVLDVALVVTIALFIRASRTAGLLLVPYLGWVLFASALNYSIWSLNA